MHLRFAFFIFASFVLFFLLQISANRGLDIVIGSSLEANKISSFDSVLVATGSLLNRTDTVQVNNSVNTEIQNRDVEQGIFIGSGSVRQLLAKLADYLEKRLDEETDEKEKEDLRKVIQICRSPEHALAKILQYISWSFFLLLPIFALILKLAYIRTKNNYIKHLVFSVHVHSFIFIVLIISTALNIIANGTMIILTLIFLIFIPVYLIIAIKKFYGQTTGKVVLKFISVSAIYNIIFLTVLSLAIFNALTVI